MAKEIYHNNGISRIDYQQDKAQLEGFEAIESDWKELFRWLMYMDSSGLWNNHVLTVLIEISQTNVGGYKTSFIQGRGTASQQFYAKKLEEKIGEWIRRLKEYLQSGLQTMRNIETNEAMQAAQMIKKRLEESLPSETVNKKRQFNRIMKSTNQPYYKMLSTVDDIQTHCDYYVEMIEKEGDMDAGLSLLLTYIRNYSSIVQQFNRKFSSLPAFYRNEVLHMTMQEAIQDHTYVVVTPVPSSAGFWVPEGTGFRTEIKEDRQELIYKTRSKEYVSRIKIEKVNSFFLKKEEQRVTALYKQPIDYANPSTYSNLFLDKEEYKCSNYGWLMESAMFILNEGNRKVKIHFILTSESVVWLDNFSFSEKHMKDAFSLWVSSKKGWDCKQHQLSYKIIDGYHCLIFEFIVQEKDDILAPCSEDVHHNTTTFPAIKILADNKNFPYDWATQISFRSVRIDTEVEGIRTFKLYNELGEVDSTQSFYLFGTQGQQGSWFIFGNEEIAKKNVTKVSIRGIWNKLPQTDNGYNDIYKDYPYTPLITNESFKVKTEWKKDGKWISYDNLLQSLFHTVGKKPDENAKISFNLSQYQQDGLFRVILREPAIGFGMEKYREIFAETMIYNSRQKEKNQKKIPTSPIVPVLSDMELSYKASVKIDMIDYTENSFVRISRVIPFPENEISALKDNLPPTFLPALDAEHAVYIGFDNALGRAWIRMYFDLVFVIQDILKEKESIAAPTMLEWDYMSNGNWSPLPLESVLEETTCGLTQSGYVEIELPERISEQSLNSHSLFWLKMRIIGDTRSYLAIRCIYMNCFHVVADNGDGISIPARTIRKLQQENELVESIVQPFPGFGGKPVETPEQSSIRQSYRIVHRNRAVTPSDYEQIILERFQYIQKVCCISQTHQQATENIHVVVFSYSADNCRYPVTPSWKLTEIQNFLSAYISPFARVRVINPAYQSVDIECAIVLKPDVIDKGIVIYRMTDCIKDYFARWLQEGTLPDLGQQYSYKELHTKLSNDIDVQSLQQLTINGKRLDNFNVNIEDLYFSGNTPWSIIIPGKISIMVSEKDSDESKRIGSNFIIG